MNRKINVKEMTKLSLCVALICISSYIVIPLPFTPIMITGQTIAINLAALILNPMHSAACIAIFILLGVSGLPVFAGGNSGLGTLFGPTGGFIIGFLFAVTAISHLKGEKISLFRYLSVTVFIGMPIIYLSGV
ncbi:MAG: biotin transporter BioY, partial [Alkaliphilus sp.]|nr:biotin transporter BioY [Alkaliphilus sp.]